MSSIKAPYKSNPIKSSINNLNDDCSKEDYHSNKLPSEKGCNILSTPTKKTTPKNINLWQKKTLQIGNSANKCCNKNLLIKSNNQNNANPSETRPQMELIQPQERLNWGMLSSSVNFSRRTPMQPQPQINQIQTIK